MKKTIALVFAASTLFLAGCERKAAPIKEGVIWSVRWESSAVSTGFYRIATPNPNLGGRYGVDMYGVLYPTCLEVRLVGSGNSPVQIIPLRQIIQLEFGDGGVSVTNH